MRRASEATSGSSSTWVRATSRASFCSKTRFRPARHFFLNIASRPDSWDTPGEEGVGDTFNSKNQFTKLRVRSRLAAECVEWWCEDTQVGGNDVAFVETLERGSQGPTTSHAETRNKTVS